MLKIIEEARAGAPDLQLVFYEVPDERPGLHREAGSFAYDHHGDMWLVYNQFIEACPACDHACHEGWMHQRTGALICADCVDLRELVPAELDEGDYHEIAMLILAGRGREAEVLIAYAGENTYGESIH